MEITVNLVCDQSVAAIYKSSAQRARVISESWVEHNGFCIACNSDFLRRSTANTKCTDFACEFCAHQYELKSFTHRPSKSLVDGAYGAMIGRIRDGSAPTLMLLHRSKSWEIISFSAINSVFLTPDVIDQRKPLRAAAARAGWVGCNIRLDRIAAGGEVYLVRSGTVRSKKDVRTDFQKFLSLRELPAGQRGWTILTLEIVRSLGLRHFHLSDVYAKEANFVARFPNNNNVRAKIRQQLQILRDRGYLQFDGGGAYSMKDRL